ncbi:MAG: GWxTD domain-containing protein [Bacteroidetes bacterium]|nr:GWxTD domain-containing protein [Bacteroidota bacterium]
MKYIYIFFIFLSGLVFPQDNFDFEFDYAQFGYDTTSNYVEFYYSFNQLSLTISHSDTADYTEGILHVTIEDTSTGESQVDQDWLISHIVKDSINLNKNLVGVIGFILNEGIYKCDIIGKDAINPDKQRSITEILEVKPFYQLGIAMGDIQLASNIIQESDNTSSIFYKNTFEIIPIPSGIFGENQPVLFYYTELYNVKSKDNGNLRIDEHVFNSRGQVVNQKSKSISRSLDSRVEVGSVMTYKLPTDTYTLVLSLIDSAANYGISSSKKFFVYNPSVEYVDTFKTIGSNIVVGMFGVMSEEELDDFFVKSRYIASVPEIDKYEVLISENAKRIFLTNFWKARDEDPSDNMNQYLKDYMRRIKESNIKYKALSKKGWQSDRGRVYLIYGQPSEIDRYPNQTETRPYEIWRYNSIEGGVQFIFGDVTGFSDYILLHSTKRGELRDDGWQRRIVVR